MKTKTTNRHIREINEISEKSWLGVGCDIMNFNPPRSESGCPRGVASVESGEPMRRFVFRGDCFTSWDAKILPGGRILQVIYNGHFRLRFPEDAAFAIPAFRSGARVTWPQIKRQAFIFVELSNMRAKSEFPEIAIFSPLYNLQTLMMIKMNIEKEMNHGQRSG